MISPVPASAKFIDNRYYIRGGSMVRDADGKCHLSLQSLKKPKKRLTLSTSRSL
ncbi:hypothetical protein Poly41_28110 [Novipirellula artificiosorum]|uniref:Uncharacterized protein n=1 Tax=Novipirellula artificiosorum TaxID=2528016 RepID=A0A5C6DQ26_9BACT|nr:hypothetical protein Poly41_28110 [Novipirellula artificiosorum]